MPSLGADMDAGTVVEWRVSPGDRVHRGDIVALVETDKAEIEIEIYEDATVEEILVPVGVKVDVGTPLARILTAGAAGEAPAAPPTPATATTVGGPAAAAPVHHPPRPPAARGHGRASPLARRRAAELGVDLAGVTGTGPGGAVTGEDVERAAAPAVMAPVDRRDAMRRAIGELMARSKREIPHYYLETTIDAGRLLEWLERENERRSVAERILPAAALVKATALAAREEPSMNGFFLDGAFEPSERVHVGIAIALRGGGLIAPAIHDADAMPLGDLMRALRDLVGRARGGRLRASEMSDPTITVSNLGEQGAEGVFSVIYPPQVALAGFGAIVERPWVVDGAIVPRPVLRATLAADHRVSDGMVGSRFLAAVERLLTRPERL
jgi:pyruvate dehydrogenase E2 component (dihydrolipoamide acetyltransferase)